MRVVLSLLMEARSLLAHIGWCQGSYAKKDEMSVDNDDRQATSYCAMGAVRCARRLPYLSRDVREAYEVLTAETKKLKKGVWSDIIAFNDLPDMTREIILEVFDNAIAALAGDYLLPSEHQTGLAREG